MVVLMSTLGMLFSVSNSWAPIILSKDKNSRTDSLKVKTKDTQKIVSVEGEYSYGPNISVNEACERAIAIGKEEAVRRVSQESISSVQIEDCRQSNCSLYEKTILLSDRNAVVTSISNFNKNIMYVNGAATCKVSFDAEIAIIQEKQKQVTKIKKNDSIACPSMSKYCDGEMDIRASSDLVVCLKVENIKYDRKLRNKYFSEAKRRSLACLDEAEMIVDICIIWAEGLKSEGGEKKCMVHKSQVKYNHLFQCENDIKNSEKVIIGSIIDTFDDKPINHTVKATCYRKKEKKNGTHKNKNVVASKPKTQTYNENNKKVLKIMDETKLSDYFLCSYLDNSIKTRSMPSYDKNKLLIEAQTRGLDCSIKDSNKTVIASKPNTKPSITNDELEKAKREADELRKKLAALKKQQQSKLKIVVAEKPKSEFSNKPINVNFKSITK